VEPRLYKRRRTT